MLFQIPHVAGFDDPHQPWWPLSNDDARMLAEPSTRMLARLPAARVAKLALWIDPITLLLGVAALVGPRLEMTRAYGAQMRVQLETEARRRAIARNLETPPVADAGRSESPTSPGTEPESNSEGSPAGGHRIVQDLYAEGA
ncbi:MAG: hypothetical protein ACREUU_13585 [Gammaproteobacteria bacterium]